jgi:hypothetical protein
MNALTPRPPFASLPRASRSRLTHSRLRKPTPLPQDAHSMRSYLDRLLWLFRSR